MLQPHFYPRAQAALDRGSHQPFDLVGYLPGFGSEDNPAPAVEQLDASYQHGGGWHDFQGFTLNKPFSENPTLTYPGDPPTEAVCYFQLRDERVILFDHAWVAVVQPDETFRISRMD